jgi:alcohol dehydrogenase (NADP+)
MSSADASLPTAFVVNSLSIPAVGFGTFQGEDGNEHVKDAVLKALQKGYRHIDTAAAYGNEKEVGNAIKESGIKREDIFVTTKLYVSARLVTGDCTRIVYDSTTNNFILLRAQTWHSPADVEEALDRSLKVLQLDYGTHRKFLPRIKGRNILTFANPCTGVFQWTYT